MSLGMIRIDDVMRELERAWEVGSLPGRQTAECNAPLAPALAASAAAAGAAGAAAVGPLLGGFSRRSRPGASRLRAPHHLVGHLLRVATTEACEVEQVSWLGVVAVDRQVQLALGAARQAVEHPPTLLKAKHAGVRAPIMRVRRWSIDIERAIAPDSNPWLISPPLDQSTDLSITYRHGRAAH
jgi:hypothetical protein